VRERANEMCREREKLEGQEEDEIVVSGGGGEGGILCVKHWRKGIYVIRKQVNKASPRT
jgi:hypothetical protein